MSQTTLVPTSPAILTFASVQGPSSASLPPAVEDAVQQCLSFGLVLTTYCSESSETVWDILGTLQSIQKC